MILTIFRSIFDWAEVWALLIPLTIFIIRKPVANWIRPVKWYVITALFLNICINIFWYINKFELFGSKPGHIWNNNVLYNLNSVARLLLFAWFFNLLRQRFMHRVKAIIPYAFLVFVLINFIIYENFIPSKQEIFSSRLLSTEAALLLFYCLQYFIYMVIEDKTVGLTKQPGFWIVTGLSIYMAVSFFIFLFYDYLRVASNKFAVDIWDVHNSAFILLCILISKQFYQKNG
jgi:hypothetical protein